MIPDEAKTKIQQMRVYGIEESEILLLFPEISQDEIKDFFNNKNGHLPEIIVSDRQLRDPVAESMAALILTNIPPVIFQRAGELVRLENDENGHPYIKSLTKQSLRGMLSAAANYLRLTTKGSVNVSPRDDIIETILSAGTSSWKFPPLADIIECPVFHPDGSLLSTPGYDPATRLYHQPAKGLVVPAISNQPSVSEVTEARNLILEIIQDFPFDNEASRANCLAAMFTPVLRTMIPGPTPLHLFDKPAPGSGATILAEVVSLIATGRTAAMMIAQKDDEGWRKAIFSLLLRGQSIITIDNIENTLQAASLASILTAHTFQDRVLGQSLMLTLPNRATWIATGNNIHVGGDLPRRCVWIKIDPKIPRPWQRDINSFAHPDLLAWVPRERGRILASMLTIAQTWINAGMPRPMNVPTLGGYEGYTKVVGGVLEAMMVTDFLGNLNAMYDTLDEDTPAWDGFLTTWHEIIGDEPITVKSLIKRLENNDQLAEALPDWLALNDKKGYSRKLGNALRKREGVRFPSGLMIKKGGQFRRAVCWQCMSYADLTHTV